VHNILRSIICGALCALALATTASAQTLYEPYSFGTLAGYSGYGSADETGSAARFYNPNAVAVDASGTVYVADFDNDTIRKITSSGVVSTLAGLPGSSGGADGTGSAARFDGPSGVAVDSSGNVYVADQYNHTIRKITSGGVVSTLAGLAGSSGSADGTGSAARFNRPNGVAVDGSGNVYVADSSNHTIRRITSAGAVSTVAGSSGMFGIEDGTGSAARFNRPNGVAVDGSGNVYVADSSNHTIRRITSGGAVSTLAGLGRSSGSGDGTGSAARFYFPRGVAADASGNVYVADSSNHTIRQITPGGVVSTLAGSAGSFGSTDGTGNAARFHNPNGLAVGSSGNVYVADQSNHTIRQITSDGVVSTLAGLASSGGSADGTGSVARFNFPAGVAVDGSGNVYVADSDNHTIRKITSGGIVSTLAGLAGSLGSADGTGSAARFNRPNGVAVDGSGTVYVADSSNHTIRKITSGGAVSTLAGLAGSSGSADGTGSAARFNYPFGVAVESSGNVYVADYSNHTVRRITSGGMVSTLAGSTGIFGGQDGTASTARFYFPRGVAVDGSGNVYVADYFNHTIRRITSGGIVSTLAGSADISGSEDGTGSAARFRYPGGVAVDGSGNVYVADRSNQTIRKITPGGIASTVAGLTGSVGSPDGTGSAARFRSPGGVAVDGSGTVYVADESNHTIRAGRAAVDAIAVSRQPHGSAVRFDIPLPLGGTRGVECRSGGVGGDYQVVISFPSSLSFQFAEVSAGTGHVASATLSGATATLNLSGVASAQNLTVTLFGANDGSMTGDFPIPMSVLVGDTNGNGIVNASDIGQTKSHSGQPASAANFRTDVNANGMITSSDIGQVKSRAGTSLP
jgi:sugar lactone lactonase YvrE